MFLNIIFLLVFITSLTGCTQFGKTPSGTRLEKISKSKNYNDGEFKNLEPTVLMTSDRSLILGIWDFLTKSDPNARPKFKIPSHKIDLKSLKANENVLVWFGHSSYFIQIDGKKILVDPVFSGHASPFTFMLKSFDGSDIYKADDMPEIDYLLITHDHYDHLDYQVIKSLNPKIKKVICGLGVGEDFEYWGYDSSKIVEGDWNDHIDLENGFTLTFLTTRHFSGRSFKRNQTLWVSYALKTPSMNFYLGGDSGYGTHFKDIGDKYGPFDLAVLENGQYNLDWKLIHMMPEQSYQAGLDLRAKQILPVHSGKFVLARHSWNEPLERISKLDSEKHLLITPMIGQKVDLFNFKIAKTKWWKESDQKVISESKISNQSDKI